MILFPLPMPSGSGGGYIGTEMHFEPGVLPPLPEGWRFEVWDRGGWKGIPIRGMLGFVFGNPCTVWLYGPHEIHFVDMEGEVQRSVEGIRRACNAVVYRSRQRAEIDPRFAGFKQEYDEF